MNRVNSLATQFFILISTIISLGMSINAVIQYNNEVDVVDSALRDRGKSITDLLATASIEPLLVYDDVSLNEYAKFTSNQKDIIFATVVNNQLQPMTHFVDRNKKYIRDLTFSEDNIGIQAYVEKLKENPNIIFFQTPIKFENKNLAYAWVGLDRVPYDKVIQNNLMKIIIVAIVLGVLVGGAIYFLFRYKIFKPIEVLTASTKNIAKFDFERSVFISGAGEITVLADSFDKMRLKLKETMDSRTLVMNELSELNESLEERVHERTQELQILNTKIAHEAMHDPLTGLPNRALIIERLEQSISQAERTNTTFAVFMMDLNNFKEVNDTLGHPEGDRLLVDVAQRLTTVVRDSDTVGRLGGDEFAMVFPSVEHDDSINIANKMLEQLMPSFALDSHSIKIGASIGIAIYPEHGRDHTSLLRTADVAMYEAKKEKSKVCMYRPELDQYTPLRLSLMDYLQSAIETNQLQLHYQPKICLRENRVTSVEALIRWYHPDIGVIFPDQFIPMAENSGLIDNLSNWIMNEAMRQWREWQDLGIDLNISINLSARNMANPDLPEYVAMLCDKYQVVSGSIKIEITESAIMYNPEQVIEIMSDPHMKRLQFSIDDFGTGYSSLSYLKRLPVAEVKIDKSFIFDMLNEDSDASIVESVIDLVHNLGYSVVAEGVENSEILEQLREYGCDEAQGYYFSKAQPVEQLLKTIEETEIRLDTRQSKIKSV